MSSASALAAGLAGWCRGAVVGVLRGGVEEVGVWGERVPGEPVGPEAVFDLASVTKLATTVATGRAVAEGRLQLGSTVGELLEDAGLGPLGAVTVEQLLRHRSGLAPWAPLYLLADDPAGAVDWILRHGLRGRPGDAFVYSDLGMVLLGELLVRRTGTPLPALLEQAVAELAGRPVLRAGGADPALAVASDEGDAVERRMVDTGEPHPVPSGLDVDSFAWRTRLLVGETDDGNAYHAFGGVAGHAGGFASVPGLLAWGDGIVRAWHGADGPAAHGVRALLSAPAVDGQGLGFRHRDVGTPLFWHPGFTGTALAVLPERRLVLALGASRLLVPEPVPTTELFDHVLRELLR
ncbi:serine hydrolase domain-containing protein [Desertihabitans aurantiacus]|uniref:serine hydrolase domain-containing protein n=1 Tax=Desertihabitans aurantiacus TaxID=2282477 RepID=UPI000DF76926|nr:serine hydrolase domain-containing protein [Desertihabitans aurantiacus]